jgi:acetyltransferase-like isoleucine patch superfamily enzyme
VNPITFLTTLFSNIPPFVVIYMMLQTKGQENAGFETANELLRWFSDPKRIPYFIGIRVARALLSPFFYMAAALFWKKVVIGPVRPGPRRHWNPSNSHAYQWELVRHTLAATLFSRKRLQNVADLVGRHYENVSIMYRLLGAKVGKRVFWSGQLPICSGEFDLLEVGDDVVFGSRSSIFLTTLDACEKVILCAGSNVADNCVVLPGSIIGKNAVLGSNSVCPEGWYLPERSVWLGSSGGYPSCLERGVVPVLNSHVSDRTTTTTDPSSQWNGPYRSVDVTPEMIQLQGEESTLRPLESTIRPFGRAFYQRKTNYFIWPLWMMVIFSFVVKAGIATFHSLPFLGAIHGTAMILYGFSRDTRTYDEFYRSYEIYMVILVLFIGTNLIRVILWLCIELMAKWMLMGRRREGRYNYDTSSYAQRWEIYQLICKIRKFSRLNFLDFFSGTPYMVQYFRWNGGTIGNDVCLYPAGADPFMPEPDLVRIGHRCVLDCAALVCHLNTRGNFELKSICIEDDCTLRARSRTQQGVMMETGSQLLEKSLALTGEVLEAHTVWQGCPASPWYRQQQSQPQPQGPSYSSLSAA